MARSSILNPVMIAISLIALGACGETAPVDIAAGDASAGKDASAANNDAGVANNDSGAARDAPGANDDASVTGDDDASVTGGDDGTDDDSGLVLGDDGGTVVIEVDGSDDGSTGTTSACGNAGGFCTGTGASPCAKVAPASAQDCNVHALPSGSFCCLSASPADSGP